MKLEQAAKIASGKLAAYALSQSAVIHIPALKTFITDDVKLQEEFEMTVYETFNEFLQNIYPEYWEHLNGKTTE